MCNVPPKFYQVCRLCLSLVNDYDVEKLNIFDSPCINNNASHHQPQSKKAKYFHDDIQTNNFIAERNGSEAYQAQQKQPKGKTADGDGESISSSSSLLLPQIVPASCPKSQQHIILENELKGVGRSKINGGNDGVRKNYNDVISIKNQKELKSLSPVVLTTTSTKPANVVAHRTPSPKTSSPSPPTSKIILEPSTASDAALKVETEQTILEKDSEAGDVKKCYNTFTAADTREENEDGDSSSDIIGQIYNCLSIKT